MSIVFRNLFSHRGKAVLIMAVMAVMMLTSAVAFAQTAVPPPTIDLDVTPLFDSMNSYLPVFLVIFAIPGGIALAIGLVRLIINAISSAIAKATGKA